MKVTTCNERRCKGNIVWATTRNGKLMPVDAEPNALGNVELIEDGKSVRAIVHGQSDLFDGMRHMPHWATCAEPERWPS